MATEQIGTGGESAVPFRVRDNPERVMKVLRERATDESSLRSQLALCINGLIRERHLTQTVVSGIFGIPQPHISELRNNKLSRFSSERLLRFITLLDHDVEIAIRPKALNHEEGVVSVQISSTSREKAGSKATPADGLFA